MTKTNIDLIKSRHWAFLVYPDSAREQWIDFLINTGAKFCISPIHDKDTIDLANFNLHKKHYEKIGKKVGDLKKPHYHVIYTYSGPTTEKCISKRVIKPIGATELFPLVSVSGMYEYLWHNPDRFEGKTEYNKKDIVCFNGFNPGDYIDLTSKQTDTIKNHIIQIIKLNNIIEIGDLIDVISSLDDKEMNHVLTVNYNLFCQYINSRRNKPYKNIKLDYKIPDVNTGEIKQIIFTPEQLGYSN